MIKGLYTAASAMLAQVQQQQSLAHNIANITTPGFKSVLNSLDDFMTTQVNTTTPTGLGPYVANVGTMGLGVENAPETIDFSQGGIQETANELDFSVEGDGFFRVQTPAGERYTRDGRFLRDANSQLVTVDGNKVLNNAGQPITVPLGQVSVGMDGTVSVNNMAAGQIGLANFQDPRADLERDVNNTFVALNAPSGTANGQIHQGSLEGSNANPSQIATQMVTVARSYQAAQQMVQTQDQLLGETISSLGRLG
jgi:flagellar basal body rod protein FlgG